MAWTNVNLEQWAKELGVDVYEIDQKLKLRELIVKLRKQRSLTQQQLAKRVGVSRTRVAQIENGTKLHKMSFDILFKVLHALGCEYRITTRKLSA